MVGKCSGITKAGKPCRGVPVYGSQWCMTHHPDLQERQAENRRAGGSARSDARRAAKAWTSIGQEIGNDDLPAILRSCMVAVRDGTMEPGQANAIAALAKASVQIVADIQLEARIAELEAMLAVDSSGSVRKFA